MSATPTRTGARSARSGPASCSTTTGSGSVVELPNLSVMVMGLDDWPIEQGVTEISEPRLLKAVQHELGPQVAKLLTPPVVERVRRGARPARSTTRRTSASRSPRSPAGRSAPTAGCWPRSSRGSSSCGSTLTARTRAATSTGSARRQGKPPTVVPARFLVACEHGHLDDFPWVEFVHRGKTDCRYELRLYELGASGEVADIQVQCVRCELKTPSDRRVQRGGPGGAARVQGAVAAPAEVRRGPLRGQAAGDPARGLE